MAPPSAPTTSAFIPPPPLPEFYLPKKKAAKLAASPASTSPAESETQAVLVKTKTKTKEQSSKQHLDITYTHEKGFVALSHFPAAPGDATDEQPMTKPSARFMPPPGAGYDVPPLAVYHICRICMRPRSARYHGEHPIPINGVPPPPGICRRCRVQKVEEQKEEKVIVVERVVDETAGCPNLFAGGESKDISLGLKCLIPEGDIITRKQVNEERGRRIIDDVQRSRRVRRESVERSETEDDEGESRHIHYRHVRVRERTVSTAPRQEPVVATTIPKPRTSVRSTAQDAIDAVSLRSQQAPMMTGALAAATSVQVEPTEHPPIATTAPTMKSPERDETGASRTVSVRACSKSSGKRSASVAQATAVIKDAPQSQYDEANIRRIAREEVVKYRQAERKLEAHPDPYAHGRLVPVERRIEQTSDVKEPRPWEQVEEVEVRIHRDRERIPKASSKAQRSNEAPRVVDHWPEKEREPDNPPPRSQPSRASERVIEYNYVKSPAPSRQASKKQSKNTKEPAAETNQSEKYTGSGWSEADILKVRSRDGRESRAESRSTRKSEKSEKTRENPGRDEEPKAGQKESANPKEGRTAVWDAATDKRNVVQVIYQVGEGEVPWSRRPRSEGQTDSRISERVRELQEESDRQERSQTSKAKPASVRSNKVSESGYFDNDDSTRGGSYHSAYARYRDQEFREDEKVDVRSGPRSASEKSVHGTHSGRSASRYEDDDDDDKTVWPGHDEEYQGPPRTSGRTAPSRREKSDDEDRRPSRQSSRRGTGRQAEDDKPPEQAEGSRPRAYDLRWAAAARYQESRRAAVGDDDRYERRGRRMSAREPDAEYTRIVRVVQPVDDRWDTESYNDIPEDKLQEFDDLLYRPKRPAGSASATAPDDRSKQRMVTEETFYMTTKPSTQPTRPAAPEPSPSRRQLSPTRRKSKPGYSRRGVETKGSPSSTSTRVRFASKVEISPTPPGSDASSTQFRIIGGPGSGSKRRIDGDGERKQMDGESGEDLIEEYERRGRTRSRTPSSRSRVERLQPSVVEEAEEEDDGVYYYERKEKVDGKKGKEKEKVEVKEVRKEREEVEYRPKKSRPLNAALSESPSREQLSETVSSTREKVSAAGGSRRSENAWRESVVVEDGRGSVRATASGWGGGSGSGRARGGWDDGGSGRGGGGWGEGGSGGGGW
jgi:hypothetical protein